MFIKTIFCIGVKVKVKTFSDVVGNFYPILESN